MSIIEKRVLALTNGRGITIEEFFDVKDYNSLARQRPLIDDKSEQTLIEYAEFLAREESFIKFTKVINFVRIYSITNPLIQNHYRPFIYRLLDDQNLTALICLFTELEKAAKAFNKKACHFTSEIIFIYIENNDLVSRAFIQAINGFLRRTLTHEDSRLWNHLEELIKFHQYPSISAHLALFPHFYKLYDCSVLNKCYEAFVSSSAVDRKEAQSLLYNLLQKRLKDWEWIFGDGVDEKELLSMLMLLEENQQHIVDTHQNRFIKWLENKKIEPFIKFLPFRRSFCHENKKVVASFCKLVLMNMREMESSDGTHYFVSDCLIPTTSQLGLYVEEEALDGSEFNQPKMARYMRTFLQNNESLLPSVVESLSNFNQSPTPLFYWILSISNEKDLLSRISEKHELPDVTHKMLERLEIIFYERTKKHHLKVRCATQRLIIKIVDQMVFDELLKKALLMKLNADVGSLSYYSLARPLAPPEETVNCPYTSQLLHRSVFDNFQLETKRLELDPKNAQTFSLITSTLKRYREMIHLKPRMTFDAITVSLFELLIKFFQRWENIRNLDADFSTFDLLLAACEANLSSLEPGGRTLVNQQLVPLILNSNVRHKYSHFVIMALKTLKFLLEKMSDDVPIIPNFTGKDVLQIPLRICNSSSNDQKGAVELAWQCASLLKHEATVAESLEALSTVDITGQIPVVESLLRTLDNPDCYIIYRDVGNERNDGIDDFIWALWREIKANFGSRHCHQLYELFSRVLMHEDSFFSRFADLVMEKLFKEIQDKAATRHGMILPIISKYARYCAYPDHKPFLTFAALTSGAGFNKDVLVELHTARKVDELEEQGVLKDIPQNEYQVDILTEMMMVRKYGVDLILRYIKDEVLCNECPPNDVIMMLVKEHIRETKRKQTCHKNSATHLTRERCWQSILLLVTQLIEENIKLKETDAISELVDAILNTLSNEEEPSVRMLQQISLAKLITYSTEEWKKIDQILEDDEFLNYSGSISSVLVVGMLFCISVKIPQFTMKFLEQSLRLQQCSNINVRIHAIAVVNKLYKSTQNDPAQGVAINQVFPFLGRHVQFSDSQKERGSLGRQVDKVMGNMFFSEVNVMDDLSFVGIFRSIPLSVGSQEKNLISVPLLQELSHRTNLPFEKQMDRWAERKWKAANESGDNTPNADVKTEPGVTDVQQKITPWIQDIELEKKSCEGLVICASLIDKANNLGGITRTAEVFGAESLTFDNLSVLKAKDYTSLAVTAMKWIDIQEVKARNIPQWLMSMKNKGYCLAGLEQTANSISIEEFNFPKKCVVVLGNEREGIPAHIIGLLDVVLEIPQKGIIRSLNVHVSAALSIWEYTRGNL